MQTEKAASNRGYSGIGRSLRPLAAAVCLWPAVAAAQPPNPTASDARGNTAAGTGALLNVTNGSDNTAIGRSALVYNTTGNSNTASGALALHFNTTGNDNAAFGQAALSSNTTGGYNTASGALALVSNTTGLYNTASGRRALYANSTGCCNTATGAEALEFNTTGIRNTAGGYNALGSNTIGSDNTASGSHALYANTIGKQNTAIGGEALYVNVKGNNNVAVGYGALSDLTAGNIALGTNAGSATKSGGNNIYIGHIGGTGDSAVTRIGRKQTKVFVAGIAGVPLSGATVVVRSNGQLGVVASSARYKQDIAPLAGASEKLAQLRPVSYRYKAEPGATHYGLIAEEVDKVMPELVVRDDQGRPESVQYLELVPLLLQQRQELQAELARQRALIEQQAEALAALRLTLHARLAALDRSDREGAAGLK